MDGETRLILSTDEHGGIVAVNGGGNGVAGMVSLNAATEW